jgi:hypothetical protein
MATLAELVGADLPEGAGPDSYSFLPVLMETQPADQPVRERWFMETANGTMLVREGRWKYINSLGSGGFSKPGRVDPIPGGAEGQLYDLFEDPGETTNLWFEKPEVVKHMREALLEIK